MFYDVFEHLCEIKGVSPTRAVEEMGLARTISKMDEKQLSDVKYTLHF